MLAKTSTFLYDDQIFPKIVTLKPIREGYKTAIRVTRLSVINTPGHSPGSVCYKLDTGEGAVLIAGDTLWDCHDERMGSNLDQWEESLARLDQEHFDYVTFGHGISKLVPNAIDIFD